MSSTPSQTVGPFFHIGFDWLCADDFCGANISSERVTLSGKILDGEGKPITDALIEIWQADIKSFGRIATDEQGAYRFTTIKPKPVQDENGAWQAPHINVSIFMRGLLKHLVTRIYFADEASNADDLVLKLIPPQRRATLMAKKISNDTAQFEWPIIVQGENETVFFDC
jgi:protocatechuate 3,4-dioxygenase, alpha subunit